MRAHLGLVVLALLAASPAEAGRVLWLRCDGFETQVMEGRGFAEAALGLERTPLWCPDGGMVQTAWVAGHSQTAQDLSRLAASSAVNDTPVRAEPQQAIDRLGLTPLGRLRARLAEPADDGYRLNGTTCQPLRRYYGNTDFPPCRGSRLEVEVVPRVWD